MGHARGVSPADRARNTAREQLRLARLNRNDDIIADAPAQIEFAVTLQLASEEIRARAFYGRALSRTGSTARALAETNLAWDKYQHCISLGQAMKLVSERQLLSIRGEVARAASAFGDALSAYGRLLDIQRTLGNLLGEAYAVSEIGITWQHVGDTARGKLLLQEAASLARRAGSEETAQRWLGGIGDHEPLFPEDDPSPANLVGYVSQLLSKRSVKFDEMKALVLKAVRDANKQQLFGLEGTA